MKWNAHSSSDKMGSENENQNKPNNTLYRYNNQK